MIKKIVLLFLLFGSTSWAVEEENFSFLLASSFNPEKHSLADYYLSEKLDGVRAYWDGQRLQSRGGNVFSTPKWFLDALPSTEMDGELWAGRQTFDEVSGIVRRSEANGGWRKITFMVFELPTVEGDFTTRYQKMLQLYEREATPNWGIVEQLEPPTSIKELNAMLIELDKQGGEGFMLKSKTCLLYTSPSPRDLSTSRMPSSA